MLCSHKTQGGSAWDEGLAPWTWAGIHHAPGCQRGEAPLASLITADQQDEFAAVSQLYFSGPYTSGLTTDPVLRGHHQNMEEHRSKAPKALPTVVLRMCPQRFRYSQDRSRFFAAMKAKHKTRPQTALGADLGCQNLLRPHQLWGFIPTAPAQCPSSAFTQSESPCLAEPEAAPHQLPVFAHHSPGPGAIWSSGTPHQGHTHSSPGHQEDSASSQTWRLKHVPGRAGHRQQPRRCSPAHSSLPGFPGGHHSCCSWLPATLPPDMPRGTS